MTPKEGPNASYSQHWVGFRPKIKVLDCTIRDGGLMNDHGFDDELVKAVYDACVLAGIDYMELGYKGSKKIFPVDEFGPWKHCDEKHIRRVIGDKPEVKLAVMADAERTNYHDDILPKEQSILDMIRVACYVHQVPTAIDMIEDAHQKGYETTCNLMAVSGVAENELDDALRKLADSSVETIYVVDSFGALYSEQVRHLTQLYLGHAKDKGKEVGIHTHNNQQLAYANTIEAIITGANRLDASLAGLGRGAGNCPMELLIGFLHNPKFQQRPLLECIRDHIEPLRESLGWGPSIPYMITGQMNEHPRTAMEFMKKGDGDIVDFFDTMQE